MAINFNAISDSRAHLSFSNILAFVIGTPAASDYVTGGYPVYSSAGSAPNNPGQQMGMGFVHGLTPIGYTGTAINYIWLYNKTTCKLQVFSAPGTEVAASTDLSGGTVSLMVFGY